MPTKKEILEAITQTTKENNGVPLGRDRFEKVTGINSWEIGKYWARFSDAQLEAGFSPNKLNTPHNEEFLLKVITELWKEIGHFPTRGEMRLKRFQDSSFPSDTVFYRRFGNRNLLIKKISEYAKANNDSFILTLCEKEIKDEKVLEIDEPNSSSVGYVYLARSGRYHKIGRTNSLQRRHHEINIQLPETLEMVHEIKTDDASGVEAYWHNRFKLKRKQGEWFDLSASDIKSFRMWKRIA